MVYKTERGTYEYSHKCGDKLTHREGPFASYEKAGVALEEHKESCER